METAENAAPAMRRRPRRTQEQRRAATRSRLIRAVIDVICRKGYAGLRAKHVTAASGKTWGAAQHLFGGKNELLLQVGTRVTDELVQRLESAGSAGGGTPLRERVEAVVTLIWSLYSSPDYFAMVEIVRGTRSDARFHTKFVVAQERLAEQVERRWLALFADVPIDRGRSLALCNIVVLTLAGLAARKIYLRLQPNSAQMLEELVESVTTGLGGTVESHPTRRRVAGKGAQPC
jgi:AcrR family transcriptional regulator